MVAFRPLLLWLLALIAFSASAAHAELPPRPTGPIADVANIIPDGEEAALDRRLRDYNKATGRAVIVATVPSLDGQVIERYTQDLARSWGISGKESTEGVLVLVAPSERKVRLHVAVGSQGRLTDGLASRIIRESMTPKFKAGDFGGGLADGVGQIIAQLDRDEVDAQAVVEAAEAAKHSRGASGGGWIGGLLFWVILVFVLLLVFRSVRRRGRRKYGHGIDLWDVGEIAANVAVNVAVNSIFDGDGGGGSSDGGFGGFGGGGGGFDGGGASGDW